ncbi:MAG: DUF2219 family protein [Alphaproteobacteria bacterium]|nr:DUF2219 family protein [Alphaproteobacteria bacterium]
MGGAARRRTGLAASPREPGSAGDEGRRRAAGVRRRPEDVHARRSRAHQPRPHRPALRRPALRIRGCDRPVGRTHARPDPVHARRRRPLLPGGRRADVRPPPIAGAAAARLERPDSRSRRRRVARSADGHFRAEHNRRRARAAPGIHADGGGEHRQHPHRRQHRGRVPSGFAHAGRFWPAANRAEPAGLGILFAARQGGWYMFGGLDARYTAYDITLDERGANGAKVKREPFGGDIQAGLAGYVGDVRLSYTQVWRTREFREQKDGVSNFGAFSLTIRL